ncbi:hypothetical protein NQ314_013406 [Rhamnusium bicolor]|uniref:Fibronectin type-III domain-containing protein n=1 Tax=Rhamnusium bicolor TaxID=1586634 RepID=A0AAV8X7D1_9CUCU|nr:hypothetical protein NQ314_013406 [Rhamnusium bicolor]
MGTVSNFLLLLFQFRIALILGYHGHHGDPIVSSPSVVISTLASGIPASPPTNVRATPVDSTSNQSDRGERPAECEVLMNPDADEIFFQEQGISMPIRFKQSEMNSSPLDIPPENSFYMVRNVKPLRNYTINIRMRNNYGSGPAATTIVSTPAELQSIGIHISKKLIFIADTDGYVSKIPMEQDSKNKIHILKPQNLDFIPLDITVDWLNDQLYILGEVKYQISRYIIKRCNLDGESLTVAYAGLSKKPFSIQIDPFYTAISDLRPTVTNSQLQKVISLATANKKFYWTDGIDVFNEEYHKAYDSYFHNTIPHLTNGSYKKVFINLQSSQPWPIPINPPTNVQAIFGRNIAKTRWQPPHLLGVQGKGAWQNWSYEISITEVNSKEVVFHKHVNTTFFTINDLKENSEYILKVAAYTKFGKGPWSSEFRGSTLNRSKNPIILWSAAEGLLKSNAAGENVETVIHKIRMRNLHVTDITWFKDQIYLVTNDSRVYWHNLTSHKQDRLSDMDSIGSIAIDWIGMKLYWSNTKQQLIIRGNLNGTQQEPLLTALAKELNIDSIKAYLYWSTGIKVECAHLNGVDRIEYHDVQFFSGKQVMGLTLDMDQKFVYWIVRGSEGSNLYKAPMQGYWDKKLSVEIVSSLQKPNMQGPLCYFHKRLLWLQDDKNAAISDLSGKNIATITGKSIWGLNMVYVVDSSLHMLPDDINPWVDINVIPEMTDKTSVKVIGSSESFNVTWNPINNVNYGTVFYEVQIDSPFKNDSTIINTTTPSVKYWCEVTPFTPLNVTIRAFTYWGTSPQVRAEIFSPPSTPSAPINLRAYVIYEHNPPQADNYVSIIFRWDFPLYPNGVLQGFKLRCWYMENDVEMDICENVITMANETEYKLTELEDYEIYYFEVQAFTEIGSGTISDSISVDSSHEWPLPTLLIASSDSIFIDDIDTNQSYPLIDGIITPVELSYLMKESNLFWINKKQELIMYNFLTLNQTKIFDITGKPNGLTLDWLERSLYYVETPKNLPGSLVYKIDLNHIDKKIIKNIEVLYTASNISKIEVSPFSKRLYWVETTDGIRYKLMQSNTDGSNIRPFFSQHNHNKRDLDDSAKPCNCPFIPEVGPSFTIDHSDTKTKPLLIFINPYTLNVVSTDKDGCFCNIVANNTIVSNSFPLDRIKSDFGTLYWTNPTQGLLYALKRKEANILTKEVKVSDIVIYGQHMQPYPPRECLGPKQHDNFTVSLNFKSPSSLNIQMPDLIIHEDCFNVSMATVAYTVFYRIYNDDNSDCSKINCDQIVTFNKNVEISGLKPFTNYIVSVAVSNHFTETGEMLIGPPSIFQTAPGAPSEPQNVSALVLNPTLAKVHWLPPEQLNGLIVYYEIHWQTEGALSGVRQKRAYSETNESSSDSDRVQITTYPEPASFILINKTAYSLKLSWDITQHVTNYSVEYTPITSNEWIQIETEEVNKNILINVINLKPKTQYKFRLTLLYENDTELYIWPSDSKFIFETLGDRPSPPGIPIIQYVKPNVYKVWWEASKDNGAPIELYKLEGKILITYRNKRSTNRTLPWFNTSPSIEIEDPGWETFYNGTDTSWIISGLNEKHKYAFRVSALNSYGWSDSSEESNEFDLNEAARIAEKQNPMNLILIATGVPISICFLVIAASCYVICSGKGKQKKIQQVVPIPRAPDVELATLRELPRRGIHNTNILYVSAQQTPEEITLLPHIRRHKLMLKCWEFEPEKRPTFKYCLEVLENLHRQTLRNPTTGAHEGQYISTVPELYAGISNAAYFRDENHNSSGNSWKSETEDEATKEKTPFLSPEKKLHSKGNTEIFGTGL